MDIEGKIFEVIKPGEKCIVKIGVNPFMLDLPCPETCDFRLEDEVVLSCEIIIKCLKTKDELNPKPTNKLEVQDER
ncbi:MAG: hypothetical protein ACPL25_06190 [Ignavibacteria bacterium]